MRTPKCEVRLSGTKSGARVRDSKRNASEYCSSGAADWVVALGLASLDDCALFEVHVHLSRNGSPPWGGDVGA